MSQTAIPEVVIGQSLPPILNDLRLNGEDHEDRVVILEGHIGEGGIAGKSAYESWLDAGNVGTEEDFVESLRSTVPGPPSTTVTGTLVQDPNAIFVSQFADDADQSTALINARNTVFGAPGGTSPNVKVRGSSRYALKRMEFVGMSRPIISQRAALFDSPTGGAAQLLRNVHVKGTGPQSTMFQMGINPTDAALSSFRFAGDLATLINRLKAATFESFGASSTNPNHTAFHLSSSAGADPTYGTAYQNRIRWLDMEFGGTAWQSLFHFDDLPSGASINWDSECSWSDIQIANGVSFEQAAWLFGRPGGQAGLTQNLNYEWHNIDAEYDGGTMFRAWRGGNYRWTGRHSLIGSCSGAQLYTGNPSLFFELMGEEPNNAQRGLDVQGARFEFRGPLCKMFEIRWQGASSWILFRAPLAATNLISNVKDYCLGTIFCPSGRMPTIVVEGGSMPGYVEYIGPAATEGGIDMRYNVELRGNTPTIGAASGNFLRPTPNRAGSGWNVPVGTASGRPRMLINGQTV